jgi:LCP family protein required for cell wall assembly
MPDRPGNSGEPDEYAWLFDSDDPAHTRRRADRPLDRGPGPASPSGADDPDELDDQRTTAVPLPGRREQGPGATQVLPTVSSRPAGSPAVVAGRPTSGGGGGGGRPPTTGTVPPAGAAPRGRRRHPVRRVVVVIALLLAAYLVFLIATPVSAWRQISTVPAETSAADNSQGTTFLVVGSDARSDMTAAERKELGTGSAAGQRTDSIMLLHVPTSGEPTLVSIPRDSYVPIPGHGSNKINAAFAFGGPELLTRTVEDATGVHIDAYLEIGFVGFVDVVNAVGGVHMCLDKAMKDSFAHVNLKAGCQDLDGKQALGFVRARHSQARGDLDRVQHQRELMAAVIKKAMGPATLLPWRYWNLVHAGARSLTVGDDTSAAELATFARAMRRVSSGKGTTTTVPIATATYATSDGSAVLWDKDKAAAFFEGLRRG